MTKGPDDVDNADEDGGVFKALSGWTLAHDSGDQPLWRFFGGPEFVWEPEEKEKEKKSSNYMTVIYISKVAFSLSDWKKKTF